MSLNPSLALPLLHENREVQEKLVSEAMEVLSKLLVTSSRVASFMGLLLFLVVEGVPLLEGIFFYDMSWEAGCPGDLEVLLGFLPQNQTNSWTQQRQTIQQQSHCCLHCDRMTPILGYKLKEKRWVNKMI